MVNNFQTGGMTSKLTYFRNRIADSFQSGLLWILLCICSALSFNVLAQDIENENQIGSYLINAGDILRVDVWNEPTLSQETVLVRPDGFISVPVIGEISVGGAGIFDAQSKIKTKLGRYLKDEPTVVVSVLQTSGSQVFVLGKVIRPGAFALRGNLDITQALALAGGTNQFAAENKIKVFRRDASGAQRVFKFKLSDIRSGDRLESNILLQSGDLVLVP